MAGKDKHPPLNPNRFSTNKRVKVGEKNAGLGAKFEVPAKVTAANKKKDAVMARAKENAIRAERLKAQISAEKKAKGGVLGFEGANRVSYLKRKFPKGGMV